MSSGDAVVGRWSERLGAFTPAFFARSPALRDLAGQSAVVLHGSTMLGIDDAHSDLDLWVFAPHAAVAQAEGAAGTRFFGFELEGKKGHFNLETVDEARQRVQDCDLERIAELRRCRPLVDVDALAADLIAAASRPMSESVRRAWFCYHYVEMRGAHRNFDNPVERGDAAAALLAMVPTLTHALRAAMVLDAQPYPYVKWLAWAAGRTPTGRKIQALVEGVVDALGAGGLRHPGPEADHPVGRKIREMRRVLIESARALGIDEPWLERWWVHMTQARAGIQDVHW